MVVFAKNSARSTALLAIAQVEEKNGYIDLVLSHLFEKNRLDSRDRAFITDLTRGTIRWKKKLDWIVDFYFKGGKNDLPNKVRWILWMALYQIDYMKTPCFAAVNESVELVKSNKLHAWKGVVNGILRAYIRDPSAVFFPDQKSDPILYLATKESYPEWIIRQWVQDFGFDEAEKICQAQNIPPIISVRANVRKISHQNFANILKKEKIEYEDSVVKNYFRLIKIDADILHRYIQDGLIVVQDESAALVGMLADPQPNQVIFDLCAAPGGKSIHLAVLSSNRATIISSDINRARIGLVKKNGQSLGYDNIFCLVADAKNFPACCADIVVLDAPCSGLGVLRKKTDIRWKKTYKDVEKLAAKQSMLIRKAASLVKKGGTLIYSTCTTEKKENENIVSNFLLENINFFQENDFRNIPSQFITREGYIRTWPHKHGMDGSFAAKLRKR